MVPWLSRAFTDLSADVREIPGVETHPRILEYHLETTLKATQDEVPWCSAAVCSWMEESGIPSTRSAAARSWMDWGVTLLKPREGCIVVFWRGSPEDTKGHVALFLEEVGEFVRVLGGNQGDKVSIQSYNKRKVLGYRWPSPEYHRDKDGSGDSSLDS